MKCPSCRHENSPALKFCGECGARLTLVCASCGAANAPAQKFCGECGTKLGPEAAPAPFASPQSYTPKHLADKILTLRSALEGERKQVTVLFCDIANSTELAGRAGAEAMHAILHRFFELALAEVHRYEGTVNQFLGDGFMALFGAPVAHEDHARRAVLAALGVRRSLIERAAELALPDGLTLRVRIGLHTGPVVVGSIGDNLRMDYTAIGDTTHLAARLQQAATPGQILMSHATARLAHGYVTSQRLPPLSVKGVAEPVSAFEVQGLGSRRSRMDDERALSPFVGRDRELEILREALDQAETGHGQVIGIVGEPGVGKSRLLYEFRRLLQEREVSYLEGWCLSFGQSVPYLPLQDILRTSCNIAATDSPAQIGERLRAALKPAGFDPDERAPYLLQALGVKEGTEGLAQISPETVKARTLETLVRMALAQSKRRTLVLAIEDLHWVDKTSEEFFVRLTESLAGAHILVVTTTRPGYSPPWLGKSYVTQLPVRVLSAEAARRIVEATVDRAPISNSVTETILRKAEGNPFFVEELTLSLLERQDLRSVQALPDTIQGVLAGRIDRLPEGAKRTLQNAAVLGREFPLRLLEVVEEKPESVRAALDVLERQEFLYERAEAEGPVFVFKHALTQEVAYDTLLTARRETLHGAAGRAIEQIYPDRLEEHYELLAHHYARSAEVEKAIEYLDRANLKAIKANAVEDAQAYFEEALRQYARLGNTMERKRTRIALMTRQAPVFMLQMKMIEYERLLRAALPDAENIDEPALHGSFLACLAHCEWFCGRYDESIETNLRAAELSERSGVFDGAAHARMLVQWDYLYAGQFQKVLDAEPAALRALDFAPHLRYRVWTLTASAWACGYLGRWEMAIERCQQAMREAEAVSDVSLVSFGAWILAAAYVLKRDVANAVRYSQLSFDTAPTVGDKAWANVILQWALLSNAPEAAIEHLSPMWAVFQAVGFKGLVAHCGLSLCEAYICAGRLDEAEKTARAIEELSATCGQRYWQGSARRLLAETLLAANAGRLAEVQENLEAAILLLRACEAEPELAHAYACYGRLKARQGDTTHAREYLQRARDIYERLSILCEPDRIKEALATLDRNTETRVLNSGR